MKIAKRDRIAQVIVEATVSGDKATCDKYGITIRTLQRWRSRLPALEATATDEEHDLALVATVAAKKAMVEAAWADAIPAALLAHIEFLQKAAGVADPKDPDVIHSVAGAMKLLSEVAVTWKVLDARLARLAGPPREADRAGAPGAPATAGGSAGAGAPATH